jgi:predicted DNA-binding transcriptional regulator AlpA
MAAARAPLRLWTVADVVRETGLPKNRIYELVERRETPHVLIGSRIYFRQTSIENWIAELEQGAEKAPVAV